MQAPPVVVCGVRGGEGGLGAWPTAVLLTESWPVPNCVSHGVGDPTGPLVFTAEVGQHLPILIKYLYLREVGMAEVSAGQRS